MSPSGRGSSWGAGYVTDIEYLDGFYAEQVPQHLALAAALTGFEPPALDGHFTYCELGCGRGRTSLVLAAINVDAEFHAIDFNPAHIAHAREQARRAGLRNITFHELSFAELPGARGAALPMFDVITMHGVWTWIAPEMQSAILDFLNVRLNPGGLLYVSYNALPAWYQAAPLQRLIREFASAAPQRSDLAATHALEQIERLAAVKFVPERFRDATTKVFKHAKKLPYLVHEHLNEFWQPAYFMDVARSLARAKLIFVACSDLLKNFHNLALTDEQRSLIAQISSPELRETLQDFCTDNWFRQDVFLRGARRMSEQRREQLLGAQRLALLRRPPEAFEINRPDGSRWRPDAQVYNPVFKALQQGPRSVAELLRLEELPKEHLVRPVELVGMLVGTGVAGLYREPSAAQIACAESLNGLLEFEPDIPLDEGAVITVPAACMGVPLSAPNYALYRSLRRGETPVASALAAGFIKRCLDRGGHPIVDNKPIEDPAEAQAAVTRDYEIKIEQVVPIWRAFGML
jgi:SAM-dependent methyltransferase